MLFSSLLFVLCFLPTVIVCYYMIPLKYTPDRRLEVRNVLLLIFSLLFYALGGAKYLILMGAVILINYLGGFLVSKDYKRAVVNKLFLTLIILLNISILFFFKYFNFFGIVTENVLYGSDDLVEKIVDIFNIKKLGLLNIPEILLPVGISFYTFQALSYVIDVYRKNANVQRDFVKFALYISFFPQLIAGPIVQYRDVEAQIIGRRESTAKFADGITRFSFGMAKKVLIANTMGEVADIIWNFETDNFGALIAWFGAICYSFQIYYDFSGYSDMAIGLGKMFGFEFKENFNYPYRAESIQDFWRRWHISLSSWFREYVYIPCGGSRNGMTKTCRNVMIVFLLTGIWHGANWTFIVWGVSYGILLVLERLFIGAVLKKIRSGFVKRTMTFIIVTILWIVFRADNIVLAGNYISNLFRAGDGSETILSLLSAKTLITFVIAALFGGFVQKIRLNGQNPIIRFFSRIFALALLSLSLIYLINGTYNPFIYFQF